VGGVRPRGQREEAAPSKADRKGWTAQRSPEGYAESRRPAPGEEAPEQAEGVRRRRFVVRPQGREEPEAREESPATPWRPEPPPLPAGDPLAAFMADAPPLAPPPGVDRLRALAARSGRTVGERLHAEVPGRPLERPSHEKKASRSAPAGKRKDAHGGGKPPKSGGKFKPGRRKR